MNYTVILKMMAHPFKEWAVIISVFAVSFGCTTALDDKNKIDIGSLKAGETVYVCGCPDMCCNSISRDPSGVCECNYPLKPGTVSKIHDGKVYVMVSDIEKIFLIPD
jgi:hypothetical protein